MRATLAMDEDTYVKSCKKDVIPSAVALCKAFNTNYNHYQLITMCATKYVRMSTIYYVRMRAVLVL